MDQTYDLMAQFQGADIPLIVEEEESENGQQKKIYMRLINDARGEIDTEEKRTALLDIMRTTLKATPTVVRMERIPSTMEDTGALKAYTKALQALPFVFMTELP